MTSPGSGIIIETLIRVVKITPKEFRLRGIISFLFLFLNSALDLAGLGAVIPLIIIIIEPNAFEEYRQLSALMEMTGVEDQNLFIVFICSFIFLSIVIKNLLSLKIQHYQANFSYHLQRHFSALLFRSFYAKGFLYFKSLNSANITRNIQGVPAAFALNILLPLMTALNEIVMVIFIIAGLLIYDPSIVMLLVLVVGPTFTIFYYSTRKVAQRNANMQHKISPKLSKNIVESVYGYTDVRISNTKEQFLARHHDLQFKLAKIQVVQQVLKIAPSKIVESSMFLGIMIMIIYGLYFLPDRSSLITLLGVFAIAAYRILPSVNRVLGGVLAMSGYKYTLDLIEREVQIEVGPDEELIDNISFDKTIRCENVSFSYETSSDAVLKGINISIAKGESIGFIGKSGSGKSTMMNLLLGFLAPQSGNVFIDDKELNGDTLGSWRENIGYVAQDVYMVDGNIRQNVAFGQNDDKIDDNKVLESLRMASLGEFLDGLEFGLESKVGERGGNLSGGQRQRIGIARALYYGAEVLFFDEATSALDNETEEEVTEAINNLRSSDLTMIIVAHRISTLKYCNRILEFNEGEITREVRYDRLVEEVFQRDP